MSRRIIAAYFLLIIIANAAFSGNGTSGFEFLRTDFSSRSSAMAGAFVAMRGDLNGIFHNPATMAFTDERQFAFNYMNYLLDINGGFAGYTQRLHGRGQVSSAILYLDYGNFDETNEFAEKTGRSYGANDFALAVSYSDILEEHFSYGVTAKYVHSKIDIYAANAMAFDFGLIYEATFQRDLFIGVTLLNVGRAVSAFIDTKESLPLSLRIGFSKSLAHLPLTFTASFNDLNVSEDAVLDRVKKFSIGGEFTLSETLQLRLGYDNDVHQGLDTGTGAGFSGVSLGFGLSLKDYKFGYGFSSFGDLGGTHRFGISGNL